MGRTEINLENYGGDLESYASREHVNDLEEAFAEQSFDGVIIRDLYIGITFDEVKAICSLLVCHSHTFQRLRLFGISDDVVNIMLHSYLGATFPKFIMDVRHGCLSLYKS